MHVFIKIHTYWIHIRMSACPTVMLNELKHEKRLDCRENALTQRAPFIYHNRNLEENFWSATIEKEPIHILFINDTQTVQIPER